LNEADEYINEVFRDESSIIIVNKIDLLDK